MARIGIERLGCQTVPTAVEEGDHQNGDMARSLAMSNWARTVGCDLPPMEPIGIEVGALGAAGGQARRPANLPLNPHLAVLTDAGDEPGRADAQVGRAHLRDESGVGAGPRLCGAGLGRWVETQTPKERRRPCSVLSSCRIRRL